eukprot:5881002-Ditylum_brightwellii.AAC.1
MSQVNKEQVSLRGADIASKGVDHLFGGDVNGGIDDLVEMEKIGWCVWHDINPFVTASSIKTEYL